MKRTVLPILALSLLLALIPWASAAEPNPKQAIAIAEIEKLGGKVTLDDKSPGKPVIAVDFNPPLIDKRGCVSTFTNTTLTDAGLANLKGLTQLQTLNLMATNIGDEGLKHLGGLTALRSLYLGGERITDTGLKHLKTLNALQSLHLGSTKISDAGLEYLNGLHNLQSLDLSNTKITDAGLERLKRLTELQRLELGGSKITDAGLRHVRMFPKLRTLGLAGTDVTDAGLEYLSGLTELESLFLTNKKVTDDGLEHIKGLSKLRTLGLVDTNVTDAGLDRLKGLTELQMLYLKSEKITDEGVKKFQQALPECKITRFPSTPEERPITVVPNQPAVSDESPSIIKAQLSACADERLLVRKRFDNAVLAYKSGRLASSDLFEVADQWSQIEQAYCMALFYSQLTQEDLVKLSRARTFANIGTDEKGNEFGVSLKDIDEYASQHGLSHQEAMKHMREELLEERQKGKSVK